MNSNDAESAKAINEVVRTYAQALEGTNTGLATEIRATDDEVALIHPKKHERDREEIKRNLYESSRFDRFATCRLGAYDVTIRMCKDMVWAEFYWKAQTTLRSDGSPLTVTERETQIFRKTDRGWVLEHVHYSDTPVTREREGF